MEQGSGGFLASNPDDCPKWQLPWPTGQGVTAEGQGVTAEGHLVAAQGGKPPLQGVVWGRVCPKGRCSDSHVPISVYKHSSSEPGSLPGAQDTL